MNQSNEPKRIVVADDDPQMRGLIVAALEDDGDDVIEVTNGKDLMDVIGGPFLIEGATSRIDLVVTDVVMPGATGLEALARIRRAGWPVPVIVVTSFGDDQVRYEAGRLGAVAVIEKPFELETLRAAVASVVHAHPGNAP